MAKIVHSELAPAEAVTYTFGGESFELGGKRKTFESNDATLLAEADTHPWLTVERDQVPVGGASAYAPLDPKLDPLSRYNDRSSDPDQLKADADPEQGDVIGTAINAGLDQSDPVVTAGVAETLAGADTSTSTKKKGS